MRAMLDLTIGKRLQRLRQAAGVSQPDLARAAGIPVGTLRNLEQGRRIPRLDTAGKLARALGVSVDALLGNGDAAAAAKPAKRKKGGK
jgi:transcriptional regulator with XRE-family HTH domain